MPIRTKLYAAMVVAACGLALLAVLSFWGMSRLGDHFDAARDAAADRAIAQGLKFDVTDFNGWQTAYGYDNGASRPIFLRSVQRFRDDMARARGQLTAPAERAALARTQSAFNRFMALDVSANAAVEAGREAEVRRLLLGPEIRNFHDAAAAADDLAAFETARSAAENKQFADARRSTRQAIVIAALVAGLFVAILLVTALDLARSAERATADGSPPDAESPAPP